MKAIYENHYLTDRDKKWIGHRADLAEKLGEDGGEAFFKHPMNKHYRYIRMEQGDAANLKYSAEQLQHGGYTLRGEGERMEDVGAWVERQQKKDGDVFQRKVGDEWVPDTTSDDQVSGGVEETAEAGLETELVDGEEDQEDSEGGYAEGDEEEEGDEEYGGEEEEEGGEEEDGAAYADEEDDVEEEDGAAYASGDEETDTEDASGVVVGGEATSDAEAGGDVDETGTDDSALASGEVTTETEDDSEEGGATADEGEADDALTAEEELAGGYEEGEETTEDLDAIASTQAGGYVEGTDEYDSLADVPVDAPIYTDGL
jgi:hypothetical protein